MSGTGGNEVDRLLARAAGGSRASRAAMERALVDLRTPDAYRLSERQRSLATNILDRLLLSLENDLRRMTIEELDRLGPAFRAASLAASSTGSTWRSREHLLPKTYRRLLRAAVERGNEHVIALAVQGAGAAFPPDASPIAAMLEDHADATLSQRAVDYVVAESHRYDRFGEPLLSIEELSARTAASAVWLAAATLRATQLRDTLDNEVALDDAIQTAARRRILTRDIRVSIDRRAARLVARLARIGEIDDAFLAEVLRHGQVILFCTSLAHRASIRAAAVRRFLAFPDMASLMVLMRAVDVGSEAAQAILDLLAAARDRPAAPISPDLYQRIEPEAAQRQLHRWRLDPGYVRAIAAVDEGISA